MFFNFRPDRAREMCAALTQADFSALRPGRRARRWWTSWA